MTPPSNTGGTKPVSLQEAEWGRVRAAELVREFGERYLPIFEHYDRQCARLEHSDTRRRRSNEELARALRSVRLVGHGGSKLVRYICGILEGSIDRRGNPDRSVRAANGQRSSWSELATDIPRDIAAGNHPRKRELATLLRGYALFVMAEPAEQQLLIYIARVLDGSINRRGRPHGLADDKHVTPETAKRKYRRAHQKSAQNLALREPPNISRQLRP